MMRETFWGLMQDPAHWAFEIVLMMLFDGLLVGVFYRMLYNCWRTWRASKGLGARAAETARLVEANLYNPCFSPAKNAEMLAALRQDLYENNPCFAPLVGPLSCEKCDGSKKIILDTSVVICKDCGDVTVPPKSGDGWTSSGSRD